MPGRKLRGIEEEEAMNHMVSAQRMACKSTCLRKKCGAVIVAMKGEKKGEIIGEGFNSPPGNQESQRRCQISKNLFHPKITDKTCCVHAEQRANWDALRRNPDHIEGSVLYFMRVNDEGESKRSGKPYCTICSKMIVDTGIAGFVLWHEDGLYYYGAEEYNDLSFIYESEDDEKEAIAEPIKIMPGTPSILKLFVRWDKSHYDAGGNVELAINGKPFISIPCGNNDRVYGACWAIVSILNLLGSNIDMPNCLKRHLCPDRERED